MNLYTKWSITACFLRFPNISKLHILSFIVSLLILIKSWSNFKANIKYVWWIFAIKSTLVTKCSCSLLVWANRIFQYLLWAKLNLGLLFLKRNWNNSKRGDWNRKTKSINQHNLPWKVEQCWILVNKNY